MNTADRLRQLGFQRWYERVLLESHAWLALCFLGMILAFCGIEVMGNRGDPMRTAFGLAATAVGTYLVVSGMHRYRRLMILAARLNNRATCRRCKSYGAFTLTAAGTPDADAEPHEHVPDWFKVRCDKCAHEWTIAARSGSLAA